MSIFSKMFGENKNQYVDAGTRLTFTLPVSLGLTGWHEGLPDYTKEEMDSIKKGMSQFQYLADTQLGGKATFHPDALPAIQRKVAGDSLIELARSKFSFLEEEIPKEWKSVANTFLKAWVSTLDPSALLSLGDLLTKVGRKNVAKEVLNVVLLFPSYAKTLWGKDDNELLESIISEAKEFLENLN